MSVRPSVARAIDNRAVAWPIIGQWVETYAGRISRWCCPLVSHVEHAP